jgi:hypothetical protein
MELRFAHLADFASADASGKLTIVGIFDIVWQQGDQRPVPFPPCYVVAAFAASVAEGSAHSVEMALYDADEHAVWDGLKADLQFRPFGPGYPARAQYVIGFGPGVLAVPEPGDYHMVFRVDGNQVGEASVSVLARPPAG